MRAVVCTRYGLPEVLELRDLPKPMPRNNEVCIKVFASAVTASDCIVMAFIVPLQLKLVMGAVLGFTKPRNPIPGLVLAGEVESVGQDVTVRAGWHTLIFALVAERHPDRISQLLTKFFADLSGRPPATSSVRLLQISSGGRPGLELTCEVQVEKAARHSMSG